MSDRLISLVPADADQTGPLSPAFVVEQSNIVSAFNVTGVPGPKGSQGTQGPQGVQGPEGPAAAPDYYADADLPDFTLIFANKLI
jgi:hypothetical protein